MTTTDLVREPVRLARRRPFPPALTGAALLSAAAAATALLYGHTLGYGFTYDDYVLVRPHTTAEVIRSFYGHWDPTGVMVPFYRPMTVAFNALRFELFGLDSRSHHVVSLSLFACCAALAGWFTSRLSRRALGGFLGTGMFAAHPSMPYSLVAWITNQMHLIETVTVLLALCWWHAVRRRSLGWWLPLLALGATAFLIKEDGIMLLPAVAATHWITRRVREPQLQRVPRAFLVSMVVLLAVLFLLRAGALEGLGGYGRPGLAGAWRNYATGMHRTLRLIPPDRPWQPAASAFATGLPILALLLWRRGSPGSRTCLVAGIALALLFNLPFVFVTKGEQMHLVATGAVLVLAGSAMMLLDAARHRLAKAGVLAAVAAGILAFGAVARDISTDFEPFGPIVLAHDDIVREWTAVPAQLQAYLARKREPGAGGRVSPNPADELSHVMFGMHGLETSPDGVRYQWMAQPSVELFVLRPARTITIPLRHEIGAFREPAVAGVEMNGRRIDEIRLDTGEWRYSAVALGNATAQGRTARIRISIDHVWYPAHLIPQSNDPRALGLQVGEIRVE
jgi:hypothetical protein